MRIRTDLLADGAAVAAVVILLLSAALLGVGSLGGPAHRPNGAGPANSSHRLHNWPRPTVVRAGAG